MNVSRDVLAAWARQALEQATIWDNRAGELAVEDYGAASFASSSASMLRGFARQVEAYLGVKTTGGDQHGK